MFLFAKSLSLRHIKQKIRESADRGTKSGALLVKRAGYCVAVMMLVSFLLIGCQEDDNHADTGFVPVGEWSDDFGGSYSINTNTLEFDDGFGFTEFKGTIVAAIDFSKNSGVLIIKINSSETNITLNTFIGVYYKDYTSSHVFLANAIDGSYAIIEVNTLNDAKKIFNVDNVSTHVTYWGSGYNK